MNIFLGDNAVADQTLSFEIDSGDVLAQVKGHVGLLTLNRPKALNALSLQMVRDITRALLARVCLAALIIVAGDRAAGSAQVLFVLYFMGCSFASLAQPAVGMAFPPHLAGRALSAYNLVIFAGIFVVQWGIGLAVDAARSAGLDKPAAYQVAFAGFALCSFVSWLYFVFSQADQPR